METRKLARVRSKVIDTDVIHVAMKYVLSTWFLKIQRTDSGPLSQNTFASVHLFLVSGFHNIQGFNFQHKVFILSLSQAGQ